MADEQPISVGRIIGLWLAEALIYSIVAAIALAVTMLAYYLMVGPPKINLLVLLGLAYVMGLITAVPSVLKRLARKWR